jgi:hypothetical protein
MRERERKERGEILNDRREIGWMKEIWKRRDRKKSVFFLELLFSRRTNKTLLYFMTTRFRFEMIHIVGN